MTGKERIEAAFSPEGTSEIPAVICYQGIYIRDHWSELTSCPWWYKEETDLDRQIAWRKDVIESTRLDWFPLDEFYSREQRKDLKLEIQSEKVFRVNEASGDREQLFEPQIEGRGTLSEESIHPDEVADTPGKIDQLIPIQPFDAEQFVSEGKADLARRFLQDERCSQVFPILHVPSPLWTCYWLWGFETMMEMIACRPDLVKHATERYLQNCIADVAMASALGVKGIWIEECFIDLIGPEAYRTLNLPMVSALVEEIRGLGLKSIYYYCGDPRGKLDLILSAGSDALSLEESKKNFRIDVEELAEKVQGRTVLLGNLDSIGILQNGSDEQVKEEIKRQLLAGRRNKNRFIMSTGSPVTPGTSLKRVQLYSDLVRQLGR